jgi:hypothetical protein
VATFAETVAAAFAFEGASFDLVFGMLRKRL